METNIRDKKLFIDFLEEKGLKEVFENNFEKNFGYRLYFDRDVNFTFPAEPIDYIIAGFCWHETKEGLDFWNKIDKEWKYTLEKSYQNNG